MEQITAKRVVNLYALMDTTYDLKQSAKRGIWAKSRSFIVKPCHRSGE
ncbi:MAG TPA: hypothetical protein P5270_00520 [Victivallales bacterium]|nr:hypothetical protein [Victivallales bacterium]